MLIAQAVQREEVERASREAYRARYSGGPVEAPAPLNVVPTLVVIGETSIEIPFRGRMYEFRPIGFADGLRLLEARRLLENVEAEPTPENVAGARAALHMVAGMARKYLRPRGRLRRLRWRLRLSRNPYRRATEAEVGQLLGFFLAFRMSSSGASRRAPASSRNRPTSSSRPSSIALRSGSGRVPTSNFSTG